MTTEFNKAPDQKPENWDDFTADEVIDWWVKVNDALVAERDDYYRYFQEAQGVAETAEHRAEVAEAALEKETDNPGFWKLEAERHERQRVLAEAEVSDLRLSYGSFQAERDDLRVRVVELEQERDRLREATKTWLLLTMTGEESSNVLDWISLQALGDKSAETEE